MAPRERWGELLDESSWIKLLFGALISSGIYSASITWAIRNRPTFRQLKEAIHDAVLEAPTPRTGA